MTVLRVACAILMVNLILVASVRNVMGLTDTIETVETLNFENRELIVLGISRAQYIAYAEYYGISQSGGWLDTVDQTLIFDGKGELIGSISRTDDPSGGRLYESYVERYISGADVGNISDDTYNALAMQWGLSTNDANYVDVIHMLLGIGGSHSLETIITKQPTASPPTGDNATLHILILLIASVIFSANYIRANFHVSRRV